MAGEDDDEKTEEPTQKRLDDARAKGQVVASREVGHWFMILGAALLVAMSLPLTVGHLSQLMTPFIEKPHSFATDAGALQETAADLGLHVVMVLLLPIGIFLGAAVAGPLLQHGFLISAEHVKPAFSKISPMAGVGRLLGPRALMEFGKNLLKIVVVGAVAVSVMLPEFTNVEQLSELDGAALLELLRSLATRLIGAVLAVITVVAGIDYGWQRFSHRKRLRMSRQDMKEEFRQSEGDPMIKQRIRQLRMDRARRRMMAAVPKADVVITNPTHFAVALRYDQANMNAPTVVAKGADAVAARIRAVAQENGVPLIENPPLARALYASVDIDGEVPAEHYRTVAEIISYVWGLKGRVPRA